MADEKIIKTKLGEVTAYAFAKRAGYTGTPEQFAAEQAGFAQNAQQVRRDKNAADASAEAAESAQSDAEDAATLAESWAHGGTGTRQDEDSNNAEYWARMAQAHSQIDTMTDELMGIGKPDNVTAIVNNGTFSAQGVMIQAYVRENGTRFGQDWLSITPNGTALFPSAKQVYWIKSDIAELKDQTYFWNGTQYKPMTRRGGLNIQLDDVTGLTARTSGTSIFLTWSDPADAAIEGYVLAAWKGTVIVRKAGSAPESRTDGTIVVDSTTKNAYSVTEYEDTGLSYDTTYYYRAFPYTTDYIYTDGSAVSSTPKRIVVSAVPTQSGIIGYTGQVQSPEWTGYDTTALTIGGETSGTNKGTYTATFTPNTGYEWWDGTRTAKNAEWSISKTPVSVPTVSGSFTYDTTEKAGTITGYDDTLMIKTGDETAINAGTHNIYFNLRDTDNYQWTDGTISQKTGSWTIGKASLTVPTVSGTFTYDGTQKEATISGFDNTTMQKSGEYTATNAGSHTVYFSIRNTDNYQWSDETTGSKEGVWSISKASQTIVPSVLLVSLDPDHLSVPVTISGAYGTITAVSSDTNVATVSVNGNTVTITGIQDHDGTATIMITAGGDTNHNASPSVTVEAEAEYAKIYGAEWDGTSTTAWSRTDGAVNFTDPVPAVNNGNGSSPFDTISPWKDMVIEERACGTMVKIPKFYYKLTQDGNKVKVQIKASQFDGAYVSPAHMDRGDGSGERDYIYVGRYHCASDYKSKSSVKPVGNITRSAARTSIHNLGSNIWQMDFATRFTIWLLYIVEFADWNSQEKIGYGCGNNSATENMGYTDSMTYHTGTTKASRTTYGVGTQYRHIEGLWDDVYDWLDGCYYNSGGLNIIKNPNNFSDSANGTFLGLPTSGYPSKFTVGSGGGFPAFYPSQSSGSDSTFSCDYWNFDASYPCLYAGGSYNQSQGHGLFFVSYNGASGKSAYIGCRLLELP